MIKLSLDHFQNFQREAEELHIIVKILCENKDSGFKPSKKYSIRLLYSLNCDRSPYLNILETVTMTEFTITVSRWTPKSSTQVLNRKMPNSSPQTLAATLEYLALFLLWQLLKPEETIVIIQCKMHKPSHRTCFN